MSKKTIFAVATAALLLASCTAPAGNSSAAPSKSTAPTTQSTPASSSKSSAAPSSSKSSAAASSSKSSAAASSSKSSAAASSQAASSQAASSQQADEGYTTVIMGGGQSKWINRMGHTADASVPDVTVNGKNSASYTKTGDGVSETITPTTVQGIPDLTKLTVSGAKGGEFRMASTYEVKKTNDYAVKYTVANESDFPVKFTLYQINTASDKSHSETGKNYVENKVSFNVPAKGNQTLELCFYFEAGNTNILQVFHLDQDIANDAPANLYIGAKVKDLGAHAVRPGVNVLRVAPEACTVAKPLGVGAYYTCTGGEKFLDAAATQAVDDEHPIPFLGGNANRAGDELTYNFFKVATEGDLSNLTGNYWSSRSGYEGKIPTIATDGSVEITNDTSRCEALYTYWDGSKARHVADTWSDHTKVPDVIRGKAIKSEFTFKANGTFGFAYFFGSKGAFAKDASPVLECNADGVRFYVSNGNTVSFEATAANKATLDGNTLNTLTTYVVRSAEKDFDFVFFLNGELVTFANTGTEGTVPYAANSHVHVGSTGGGQRIGMKTANADTKLNLYSYLWDMTGDEYFVK